MSWPYTRLVVILGMQYDVDCQGVSSTWLTVQWNAVGLSTVCAPVNVFKLTDFVCGK